MAPTPAPHAQQIRLRETATGRVFLAWPVDARDLLNQKDGGYALAADDAPLSDGPAAPDPAPLTARQQLEAKSAKELKALAKRAGVDSTADKTDIVEALVPLVDAGAVSLAELPPLAVTPEQFPKAAE